MKLLIIGCGGVGQSLGELLKQADSKKEWLELCVLSDCDVSKPEKKVNELNEDRFKAEKVDAKDEADVKRVIKDHGVDTVINACDPSFNPVIFDAAFDLGAIYIDMPYHYRKNTRPIPSTNAGSCWEIISSISMKNGRRRVSWHCLELA